MMEAYVAAGYDAVYITEHDMVWPDAELNELRAAWPQLRIFPGVERTLWGSGSEMQHVVILGANDPTYLKIAGDRELIDRARRDGRLAVLAHPFRWRGAAAMFAAGVTPDALEARSCNSDAEQGARAEQTAGRMGIPTVHAADAHSTAMVGHFWIETAEPLNEPNDIRRIVLARAFRNCMAT
jgi:predicted metal-dependent phosphoesterase TrpH